MKLSNITNIATLLIAVTAVVWAFWFKPAPDGPAPPPLSDLIQDVDQDSLFTWFPTKDTLHLPGEPYAVPGPIQYLPSEPHIVYVDSSKDKVELYDYILRQYIFRVRYVEPRLQVSFIKADTTSGDSLLQPSFTIQEFNLPPAWQIDPIPGGYDVKEILYTLPPSEDRPLFNYQLWSGLNLLQEGKPSVYLRGEAYNWNNKLQGSLELNIDTDAAVTARAGIGIRLR